MRCRVGVKMSMGDRADQTVLKFFELVERINGDWREVD